MKREITGTTPLRTLKGRDETDQKPSLRSDKNTLILVKKNGDMGFATGEYQKTLLLEKYNEDEGDALILIWVGQWRSDAFLIDSEDLKTI